MNQKLLNRRYIHRDIRLNFWYINNMLIIISSKEKRMIYTAKMIETINNRFSPTIDTTIARYMGFNRFQQLVENNALWLANGKCFQDENEGAIPTSFFEKWEQETADTYLTMQKIKENIYSAYISCWFEFERESELMWLSYGGMKKVDKRDSNGICIITNVGKLAAYTHYLETCIFKIKYIDYMGSEKVEPPFYFGKNTENEMPVFSGRVFYAYKQKEYSQENEIRAVTYMKSKDNGIYAKINLLDFIDGIIINPHASNKQKECIVDYLKKHNLFDKLISSKIVCKS